MRIIEKIINKRFQCGKAALSGDTLACQFRVEWQSEHYGVHPRNLRIAGVEMPHLRFGFAAPWNWSLDLDVHETDAGTIVAAQGYQSFTGGRIPFMRNLHCFFGDPEMLYQTATFHHLEKKTYVISGVEYDWLHIDPAMNHASLRTDGVTVHWQFAPAPVVAAYVAGSREWVLEFESAHVETLLLWSDEASPAFPRFQCVSGEIATLELGSEGISRALDTRLKHLCAGPGDWISLPPGEVMMDGIRAQENKRVQLKNGLWDMVVRRMDGDTISVGSARVFALDRLVESGQFPMLRPYLVRGLRSLKERILFDVVPEDDPEQYYQWGTGTWPRCYSVLALDYFGFHHEAYGYMQFMLDASWQFRHLDGLAHLWDVFSIRGPYWGDMLYDINGHAIKLYEAGKFYLNHRGDPHGIKLLDEHYDTLLEWCAWIERHMNGEGLVHDATESNLWNFGFGTFTQAPAAAGVKLFLNLAEDKGRPEDRARFAAVVDRLMRGLQSGLFGDGGNPYIGIPEGVGECHTTYVPNEDQANIRGERAQRIGLSCYSLAANFFLQDPDVGLLPPDDPRAAQTLDLALGHLGDPFDPRIIRWHAGPSHMGYGQGQLLMALVHAGRAEEFRHRLQGLFDVSHKETGDPYLMQEILNRAGFPNRGNKAHLTYFPLLAARLAGFTGIADGNRFVPDLRVTGGQPAT